MDIRCPKCSEPWDMDTIHEIADEDDLSFDDALALFRTKGCGIALGGKSCATGRSEVLDVIYDMLGDDIDGIANMTEDAEMLGLL